MFYLIFNIFRNIRIEFLQLNYNLRKKIINRGLSDFYGDDENDIFIEDDDQKQEGSINEEINNTTGDKLNNE